MSRRSVRCEAADRQENAAKKKVNSGSELTKLKRPERENKMGASMDRVKELVDLKNCHVSTQK